MPRPRRPAIAEALRHRVQRGLASGALRPGDRLPSTREMAADLDADPRVVADAYRVLAADGLVELRPRAGVFVAQATAAPGAADAPSAVWLADVVAEGVRRGVPAPVLAAALAQATESRPLQAAVVGATVDQAVGIARELRDDFGIVATPFVLDQLPPGEPPAVAGPGAAPRRHRVHRRTGAAAGRPAGVRALVIDVRPDLLSPEWRLLLREAQRAALYVVIADPRFGSLVHTFLRGADGAENVRVLVAGSDDVGQIPEGAGGVRDRGGARAARAHAASHPARRPGAHAQRPEPAGGRRSAGVVESRAGAAAPARRGARAADPRRGRRAGGRSGRSGRGRGDGGREKRPPCSTPWPAATTPRAASRNPPAGGRGRRAEPAGVSGPRTGGGPLPPPVRRTCRLSGPTIRAPFAARICTPRLTPSMPVPSPLVRLTAALVALGAAGCAADTARQQPAGAATTVGRGRSRHRRQRRRARQRRRRRGGGRRRGA
jgi:DNA-binding transcriptional regulator YhcF (GntR family)